MKRIVIAAFLLPLALGLGACSREEGQRIAAPDASEDTYLAREASWVSDLEQVSRAASAAAAHPLFRRALAEAGVDRLTYRPEYTLRAVGRSARGHAVSVTILPYTTAGDETHATFLSLLESEGETGVSRAEMLWGRDPRPDEPGFEPFYLNGVRGWIREADLLQGQTPGAPLLTPERFNKEKFMTCFSQLGPSLCSQGSAIAQQIAPGVPYREAIGCAAGTAIAAISCAAAANGK